MVDGASWDNWFGGGSRRIVGECAGTIDKSVPWDALARESDELEGGVGRADIADISDEVVPLCADAAAILINIVPAAGGSVDAVGHAVGAFEVEPDEADALTEDVVVDLVIGTVNLCGYGVSGRGVGGHFFADGHCLCCSLTE